MSYDPPHRTPPRQERWPQATPAEGWPPYRDGEGEQPARRARAQQPVGSHRRQAAPRSAVATAAFPVAGDAYGTTTARNTDGYDTGGYDTGGYRVGDYAAGSRAQDGYAEPWSDYGRAADGYAGAAQRIGSAPDGYPGGAAYLGPGSYTETAYAGTTDSDPGYAEAGYAEAGYAEAGYAEAGYFAPGYSDADYPGNEFSEGRYSDPGYSDAGYSETGYSDAGYSETGYFGSGYSDPRLTAPDVGVQPGSWQADQAYRRAARQRGLMVSAATEVLATAVVIGVSTLAAGLLRSTISPVGALGTVFIDRTPAVLRSFAMHHFGAHGRTVLLLGMYAVITVIAIAIGVAARRAAALGVTGVAAFALFVAFAAVTRPASHVSDVMPAAVGGLVGIAALLWLVRASAPIQEVTPLRPARGGTRRRTR